MYATQETALTVLRLLPQLVTIYSVFIMETLIIVCMCNAVIVYFHSELPFLMHMVIGKCLFLRPVL